jgi:hypothetical protein
MRRLQVTYKNSAIVHYSIGNEIEIKIDRYPEPRGTKSPESQRTGSWLDRIQAAESVHNLKELHGALQVVGVGRRVFASYMNKPIRW